MTRRLIRLLDVEAKLRRVYSGVIDKNSGDKDAGFVWLDLDPSDSSRPGLAPYTPPSEHTPDSSGA